MKTSSRVRDLLVRWGFVAVTVGLFAFFMATEPVFRSSDTLLSLLKFASVTAIVGLGVTITMTTGGIDLSVGSVAGLGVSVAALTMVVWNQVGGVAVLTVLIAGALVGLFNSALIVLARIPDLLATLTTMFVVIGLKLVLVDGQSISSGMMLPDGSSAPGVFTPEFLWLDQGGIGFIPVPVLLFLLLTVAVWFFLDRTRWGRALYAIGANPEAVRLAGVSVARYRTLAYVLSGLLASVGGIILAARIGQGDVSAGNSLLLDAVAVALVGSSVLGQNRPNAWGTALGAVLIGILTMGLTVRGLPYYAQDVVKGLVLLAALLISFTLSRRTRTMSHT